jgi:hypothetical protein
VNHIEIIDDATYEHPTTVLEYFYHYFPSWKPNMRDTHGNSHAIDKGHLVDHEFRRFR